MADNAAAVKVHHVQQLIDLLGGATTLTSALASITAIRDAAYTFPCPDCSKTGMAPASKYGPDPSDGTQVTCPTCLGEGKTAVQLVPVITGYTEYFP